LTGDFPSPPPHRSVFGMEDFANAIAYEVKQEIADRYFGFRTRLEKQSKEYLAKMQETSKEFSMEICAVCSSFYTNHAFSAYSFILSTCPWRKP